MRSASATLEPMGSVMLGTAGSATGTRTAGWIAASSGPQPDTSPELSTVGSQASSMNSSCAIT